MDRVEYEKLVVDDILNFCKHEELNYTPWYQRRAVWTQPQKSYLVNTLFENKPIPTIYIRYSIDPDRDKNVKEVVDGQQRIRAILEYVENQFAAKHPAHNGDRVLYKDLTAGERTKFKLTSLSIGYLLSATDSDVIEIFGRLNSVAKTLNPQESRNAKFSGEYKQFCLTQAAKRLPLWRDLGVFSANDIARMREVEFVSDLTFNLLEGLSDFSGARLNAFYAQHDATFPHRQRAERLTSRVFSAIANLNPEVIRDTNFKRPPLFFSLCYLLGVTKSGIPSATVESVLHEVDATLDVGVDATQTTKEDIEFVDACRASTQRIRSRRIRHNYLAKRMM